MHLLMFIYFNKFTKDIIKQTQREIQQPSTGSQPISSIRKLRPKLTFAKAQKIYYIYLHNVLTMPLYHTFGAPDKPKLMQLLGNYN